MWFASIWIFTLRLPWVLGADFFFRHLIDGDAAANTLSWRWVAGLQTPGKTYLARADNIARYTGGRFDPGQQLAVEAVAVDEPEPLPQPAGLPAVADRCPDEPVLMLIGEDECDPLSLGVPPSLMRAAAAVVLTERRSPLPVGEAARGFSRGACADGLARISAASACATAMLDNPVAPTLLDLASAAGVAHVVAGHAPVGPTAEWLAEVEPSLAAAGLRLTRLRRPWDAALWPHARKGYFAFKEKVPSALLRLGIGAGRGDR
jgi:deoxyribodipyrimidine photo-lyase